MLEFLTNSLIAVLTIAALLLAIYCVLSILEWGLRIRSRGREQEGLTRLWSATHEQESNEASEESHQDDQGRQAR
jgi:hypothetical protein